MRYGLDVATTGDWGDVRLLVELATDAERAGWDGFFVWDVLLTDDDIPVADPWVTMAAIAAVTRVIRIGAMVTPLGRKLSWDVARQAAALDQLSGGRLTFGAGLGSGDSEFDRLGLPIDLRERASGMEKSLDDINALWQGEPVRAAPSSPGVGARELPLPVQRPRIPVWLAAGWPRKRPLRRAALWDGVYLMTNNQDTNERLRADEVAEAAAFVRDLRGGLAGFDIAANVETFASSDEGRASSAAMAEAGATWTLDLTPDTLDDHRRLIRRGPVRA